VLGFRVVNILPITKEVMKEIRANIERLGLVFVFSSEGIFLARSYSFRSRLKTA